MAIVSITRDYGINPSIVRIVATAPDTLASVAATGYLTAQAANIALANNGAFEWRQTDEVLVNAGGTLNAETTEVEGGTNGLFQVNPTFTSLIATSNTAATYDGLTAHAGGGQTNGTPLHAGFNQFTTVTTTGDSATLPAAVLGQTVVVTNNGANSMNVFPALGDSINSLGTNSPYALAAGNTIAFYGVTGTSWVTETGVSGTDMSTAVINTMASGAGIVLAKGTATTTSGLATVNQQSGVLTTPALTTASGAAYTITLTNSFITANSVLNLQVQGGSNTTAGITLVGTPASGSATILVQNSGVAAVALNGTVIIGFTVE